jgi:hypothetical protein
MRLPWLGLLVVGSAVAGCDPDVPPADPGPGPLADAASRFDPADAGTLSGRVTWSGEVPRVPPFVAPVSPLAEQAGGPKREWPHPHAPAVDPAGRGVSGAVVFLRDVDPARARPWDLPPVRVELRDYQIHVLQGDTDTRTGFVRRGDAVEMASRQEVFHALRARGAAFFTLMFPDGGEVRSRRLTRPGVVELDSAPGYFWMRAYLFVTDHPYFARTDGTGRFTLPRVPSGRYEVVCWLPDWHEASHELDAETCLVCRLWFRPPVTKTRAVEVTPGRAAGANFTLTAEDFGK